MIYLIIMIACIFGSIYILRYVKNDKKKTEDWLRKCNIDYKEFLKSERKE